MLRALRGAIKALEQRDQELADEVIAFDDDVDERYVRIVEGIQSLLARQTPVASDLRLVLAMLHINLHLERMADYCVTIAKLTKLVPEVDPVAALHRGFRGDGGALRRNDPHCDRTHSPTVTSRAPSRWSSWTSSSTERTGGWSNGFSSWAVIGRMREYGLRMVLVSRALERIGDHAVDIGEQVAYLLTGEFREFTDASHPSHRNA